MIENMSERECYKCVYHSSGLCSRWSCMGTKTVDDIKEEARIEAIDEFLKALVDKSGYLSVGNKIVESSFIYNFTKIAELLKEQKE